MGDYGSYEEINRSDEESLSIKMLNHVTDQLVVHHEINHKHIEIPHLDKQVTDK